MEIITGLICHILCMFSILTLFPPLVDIVGGFWTHHETTALLLSCLTQDLQILAGLGLSPLPCQRPPPLPAVDVTIESFFILYIFVNAQSYLQGLDHLLPGVFVAAYVEFLLQFSFFLSLSSTLLPE